jgi:hypothetical protein
LLETGVNLVDQVVLSQGRMVDQPHHITFQRFGKLQATATAVASNSSSTTGWVSR